MEVFVMDTVALSTLSKRPRLPSATYSLRDFAALLGISYTTAHEAARRDALPLNSFRVGRQYRFRKSEVHRFLDMEPDTGSGIGPDAT